MATSGNSAAPALEARCGMGSSRGTGRWPVRVQIRLKSKSMWGMVPVKGVFREVRGRAPSRRPGK